MAAITKKFADLAARLDVRDKDQKTLEADRTEAQNTLEADLVKSLDTLKAAQAAASRAAALSHATAGEAAATAANSAASQPCGDAANPHTCVVIAGFEHDTPREQVTQAARRFIGRSQLESERELLGTLLVGWMLLMLWGLSPTTGESQGQSATTHWGLAERLGRQGWSSQGRGMSCGVASSRPRWSGVGAGGPEAPHRPPLGQDSASLSVAWSVRGIGHLGATPDCDGTTQQHGAHATRRLVHRQGVQGGEGRDGTYLECGDLATPTARRRRRHSMDHDHDMPGDALCVARIASQELGKFEDVDGICGGTIGGQIYYIAPRHALGARATDIAVHSRLASNVYEIYHTRRLSAIYLRTERGAETNDIDV